MALIRRRDRFQHHDEWHLTTFHSFGSGSDGASPFAPLLDVRGTLYGTTPAGGAYGKGTVFSMSTQRQREGAP